MRSASYAVSVYVSGMEIARSHKIPVATRSLAFCTTLVSILVVDSSEEKYFYTSTSCCAAPSSPASFTSHLPFALEEGKAPLLLLIEGVQSVVCQQLRYDGELALL